MREIRADPSLELQLAVTGMHLSPDFGLTYQEIQESSFSVDANVEMLLSSDTGVAAAKSIGLGVIGFADALARLGPDILVILGDRFEVFAAAQAAMLLRMPVAHIHGGESSVASVDEAIRHSITKMSQLHFTAAEPYRRRVIQLGESPERVFCVGAPAIDNIQRIAPTSRADLEIALGLSLQASPLVLCTYHPPTLKEDAGRDAIEQLVGALDRIPGFTIFTRANADPGGRYINRRIDDYVKRRPDRAAIFTSLGTRLYLSLMRNVDVVVGNSSSGLIEAPVIGTPTVNVGERQRGRLRAPSVIDCAESEAAILSAVEYALSDAFREIARRRESPYGTGGASLKITEILRQVDLDQILLKSFHDL